MLRDRHLPLPGAARRRPHHPRRPTTPPAHRRHLALGPSNRHRLDPHPRRVHLTPNPPDPTRRKTHRPWKARPPSDTGRSVTPTCHNWHHQPAENPVHTPSTAPHAKSRLAMRQETQPGIPYSPVSRWAAIASSRKVHLSLFIENQPWR